MAASVKKILDIAKAEIGTKATAVKKCKYNTWYYGTTVSGSAYDWCEVFIQWVFNQAKASDMLYTKTASCGVQGKVFKDKGRLVTSGYKPGDLVMFHWSNQKSSYVPSVYTLDHVGIIESVNSDGKTITTIEGNTGSSTNGEVMRRVRNLSSVSCACRPAYEDQSMDKYSMSKWYVGTFYMERLWKTSTKNDFGQVKVLQILLNGYGYKGKDSKVLAVDGVYGTNTEYAVEQFQKANKLTVDGIVGNPDWRLLLKEYKK